MRHFILSWLVALAFPVNANADVVTVEMWRGHKVVRLAGEIRDGVADELLAKIEEADVWADGTRTLLLNSGGGSVDEAMKISGILHSTPTKTVVPNGASCASACGSIVFVAGKFRIVEPFGRIGQHSCSRGGVPDQQCNEEIAMHAVENGVSHGSIAAFVTYTPPAEIIWFSREDVDGWGLSKYPGETESGFEKSEPRVFKMITGAMPAAQSAWRLDFHGDGYKAFVRTVSDAEREMQLNLFCYENLPGRLFLSMEINGSVDVLKSAMTDVRLELEDFGWRTDRPIVFQQDPSVAAVVMEIPNERIRDFLTSANGMMFEIGMRQPYVPIQAFTYLSESRKNLIFAANHCSRGEYDLAGQPLSSQ